MIGDRLGKWVIFKELGRGGMGRVYLAQEELTGRQAALKILAAELAQELGFLHRFQREIETLSRLDHPNIVRFFESGYENGLYFYAMEYVEGMSLEQILDKQSRLAWPDVLEIALQVTPALRHVHDHGVIHRDIKPSNLLLDKDGRIKLTDFGIAKVFASTHLTATGGIVGTAEFLSPEQAAGKVVGKRSDLYCFGCVLYMLLTGRPPFSGVSYVELLHKHRYGQFDRPQKFVAEIPHEIDELVCQLLEKDPDKRPRDALVFLKQLENIQRKLDRKSQTTSADNRDVSTRAENRTDKVSMEALPGPATLMSRLMRDGLKEHQRGNAVARFFNRPVVLVVVLLACIGIFTYGLWPLSEDEMYKRGAGLMERGSLADMQRAWTEYLGPLENGYPEHRYKEELEKYRRKWENAKSAQPSEAQRFYQQGELLRQQGNWAAAAHVWQNVIDVFKDVDAEKAWVRRAESGLAEIGKSASNQDRWQSVRQALRQADDMRAHGKAADAERIWSGIEQLYRNDPTAADIVMEVHKARNR
jgi:tRNA A-37 threonylcarbamoyl transferase component Bud32